MSGMCGGEYAWPHIVTVWIASVQYYILHCYIATSESGLQAMAAVQDKKVYKEGFIEKRQRGLHHKTGMLLFQKRYFKLTSEGLEYYRDKDKEV